MKTQDKSLNRTDKIKIEKRLAGYDWSALHWMERACREARQYKAEGLGQKTLAEKQADVAITRLLEKAGFGVWWDEVSSSSQVEVRESLIEALADVLKYDVS